MIITFYSCYNQDINDTDYISTKDDISKVNKSENNMGADCNLNYNNNIQNELLEEQIYITDWADIVININIREVLNDFNNDKNFNTKKRNNIQIFNYYLNELNIDLYENFDRILISFDSINFDFINDFAGVIFTNIDYKNLQKSIENRNNKKLKSFVSIEQSETISISNKELASYVIDDINLKFTMFNEKIIFSNIEYFEEYITQIINKQKLEDQRFLKVINNIYNDNELFIVLKNNKNFINKLYPNIRKYLSDVPYISILTRESKPDYSNLIINFNAENRNTVTELESYIIEVQKNINKKYSNTKVYEILKNINIINNNCELSLNMIVKKSAIYDFYKIYE